MIFKQWTLLLICFCNIKLAHHVGEISYGKLNYDLGVYWFTSSSDSKASACNVGELALIPGWGRSPEEEMATHSSIFAWETPWTEEPGGL